MRFEEISRLGNEEFRRLTGVKHSTFKRMKEILIEKKKAKVNKQCMSTDVAGIFARVPYIFSDCKELAKAPVTKWIENTLPRFSG